MLVLSQDGFMKYVSNPSDSCGARPHQQIPGGIDGTELHAFSEDGAGRPLRRLRQKTPNSGPKSTHCADAYW
jgi:hypothetical protein